VGVGPERWVKVGIYDAGLDFAGFAVTLLK
jgi:hypothetical protein